MRPQINLYILDICSTVFPWTFDVACAEHIRFLVTVYRSGSTLCACLLENNTICFRTVSTVCSVDVQWRLELCSPCVRESIIRHGPLLCVLHTCCNTLVPSPSSDCTNDSVFVLFVSFCVYEPFYFLIVWYNESSCHAAT